MKKIGTLNSRLSAAIALMGHTDKLVICDSGLPIPYGAEVIDLALAPNIPRFLDVVRVVLQELEIEGTVVAKEMESVSKDTYQQLTKLLPKVPMKKVTHEQFKKLTGARGNVTFVRTGEATPYANVIFISGVTFD